MVGKKGTNGRRKRPQADGLGRWIGDVVLLHAKSKRALRVEVVHDLRVAIRRCRSLAQGLREIDDDKGAERWRTLSDAGRALFQGLGDLRDAQVMREHAERLLADDPSRGDVLTALDRRIAQTKEGARTAVLEFNPTAWRAAAAGLPARADALLQQRALFDHLGLRRFFEARELHQSAMRSRGSTALHDLRIGVKKLRYTVENFLPDAHASIGKLLKKMQEVLGDLHDLDVLVAFLASEHIALHSNDRSRAATVVRTERDQKVAAYRALTMAPVPTVEPVPETAPVTVTVTEPAPSLVVDAPIVTIPRANAVGAWSRIRAAFVEGRAVDRAHDALIARRASSRSPAVPARALLRASFELLRAFHDDVRALGDARAPTLVRRACACAYVDGGGKAARTFADDLPIAVGFSDRDRALLAVVARAPPDRVPALDDKRVLALPLRDRALAVAVGALLHLAAALVPAAPFVVRKGRDVVVLDATKPLGAPRANMANVATTATTATTARRTATMATTVHSSTIDAARDFALRRAPFEALLGVPLWSKAPPGQAMTKPRARVRAKRTSPSTPRPPRSASRKRAPRAAPRTSASARPSA